MQLEVDNHTYTYENSHLEQLDHFKSTINHATKIQIVKKEEALTEAGKELIYILKLYREAKHEEKILRDNMITCSMDL